ncbi:Hypothetical predicted protein [Xyrichtys novacula]|uniref:Uncharacterized protein n=1 Tax=Xyrichtys novacula TaxID=13765 RepID=A0AAV1EVY3_XYRNO|nr:Hypothetical predicted protein [Xyrichtys novacula]
MYLDKNFHNPPGFLAADPPGKVSLHSGKGCLSSACFQLHPASNWCSIATIRKPQTFPETTTAINVTSTGASSPPFLFLTFFLGDSLDFSECLSLKKSKLLILKCVVNNRKVAKLVQF